MTVYFTSDLHFGHANIIKCCQRPHFSVETMDADLIRNWNRRVTADDLVYVLGDFMLYGKHTDVTARLAELNGTKVLVYGNHDHKPVRRAEGWYAVHPLIDTCIDGVNLRLSHFRMLDWRGPRLLLHGHSHRTKPISGPFSYDVGVDGNKYAPVTIAEIQAARAEELHLP